MVDAIANLAYSTVLTAPSPATSGTTVVLQSGDGAKFSSCSLRCPVLADQPHNPSPTNAEIARCTAKSGDTLTIVRAQYGTSARSVVVGDQVCQPIDQNIMMQLKYEGFLFDGVR